MNGDIKKLMDDGMYADQPEYIKRILGNFEYIQKDLGIVSNILSESPEDKLRVFENIARVRLYANEITICAEWIQKQTVCLEEDLIL